MSYEELNSGERHQLIQLGIEQQQDEIAHHGAAITAAEAQAIATLALDGQLSEAIDVNEKMSSAHVNARGILSAIKASVITNTTKNVANLKDELALVSLMQEQRQAAIEAAASPANAADSAHQDFNIAKATAAGSSEQASETYTRAVAGDSDLAVQARQHSARVNGAPEGCFIEEDPLDDNPLAQRVEKLTKESEASAENRDKLARLLVEIGDLTVKLGEAAKAAVGCLEADKQKIDAVRFLGRQTCAAAQASSEQSTSLTPTFEEHIREAHAVIETAERTAGENRP